MIFLTRKEALQTAFSFLKRAELNKGSEKKEGQLKKVQKYRDYEN